MKLASGGMATVYVGRVRGPLGFSRLVAIKRAHPHLLEDPSFSRMLVDEAKLASRIHHPNVVAVLDIERESRSAGATDLRLVMEYVEGAALSELVQAAEKRETRLAPGVVARIVLDACAGLQVAHELADEQGAPLGLVHRDVSPHNVLVGVDGLARVSDFGIAKATSKPGSTTTGSLKGKLAYMAPEYVAGGSIDARADVFAMGVVAWEAFAGAKLFRGSNDLETLQRIANAEVPTLATTTPEIGKAFDDVLRAALAREPTDRFSSARAFANALEAEAKSAGLLATHAEVAAAVRDLARETLETRREQIKEVTRQLDAARTGGTTQDGPLRSAVDKAIGVVDAKNESAQSESAPETLDGSGVTPATGSSSFSGTYGPGDIPGKKRGSPLRWFAVAAITGGVIAIATFTIGQGGDPARTSRSDSSATTSAPASSTVPLTNSSTVSSAPSTAAAPAASSALSPAAAASASSKPPPKPGPRPGETIAPNPYGPTPRFP
ncbi:MAG: serine/threonine protein kinase [Polyangiaceae bacterium]|nr:serine/threonine protein kinase [Polyangiaceae bacterium]